MSIFEWTRELYNKTVTSRCWWCTPYDTGWSESQRYEEDLSADDELRQIVAMELDLGTVPEWARRIVEGLINFLPLCGHYLFPHAYLEAVSAIGSQSTPVFIHGCYTADRERKERMASYSLCLDAWLAGVDPEIVARELMALERNHVDWHTVCAELWKLLGDHNELKELLIERTLHRMRWWIKSLVWHDDARDVFCQDEYLGDTNCSGSHYGNPSFRDPYFAEIESPWVQKLESRLADICQDWKWFRDCIMNSWLCAPKAFRFLERLLWAIGKERRLEKGEDVPAFLQCEDTYPNQNEAAKWWESFCVALRGWWRREAGQSDVAAEVNRRLGETTPVKRWLVRLLVRKLELLERHAELNRLVRPQPDTKRGIGSV